MRASELHADTLGGAPPTLCTARCHQQPLCRCLVHSVGTAVDMSEVQRGCPAGDWLCRQIQQQVLYSTACCPASVSPVVMLCFLREPQLVPKFLRVWGGSSGLQVPSSYKLQDLAQGTQPS